MNLHTTEHIRRCNRRRGVHSVLAQEGMFYEAVIYHEESLGTQAVLDWVNIWAEILRIEEKRKYLSDVASRIRAEIKPGQLVSPRLVATNRRRLYEIEKRLARLARAFAQTIANLLALEPSLALV